MLLPPAQLGSINDLGRGVRWDAPRLVQEVGQRAAFLAKMGVGRGSRVAIVHGGSVLFFADLLATWQLGATVVCLDSTLTDPELRTVLALVKPIVLLADDDALSPDLPAIVLKLADISHDGSGFPEAADINPADPALILFTSGTTGDPKGVVLSFGALKSRLALNAEAIGRAALTRTLVTLPTHFGHGLIGNALTPLLSGGEIVLHPPGLALTKNLGRIVDSERITFMSSVPALWRMALKFSSPPSAQSLLRLHVGSAPLPADLWSDIARWSRAEVVNCYGITEAANWISGASSRSDGIADGLVGKPWGGTVAVLKTDGSIAATGEGELVLQSPALMSGYFGRDDLTAAAIDLNWYKTGDRGVIGENGNIHLIGRLKDEINRAGFKVQPAEIDRLLEAHPAVAQACAFAIADPVGGEIVAVAVRLAGHADAVSLRDWCLARLRREAVPEKWFIVDELPQNARGKISRDAVRRMLMKEMPDGSR